MIRSVAAKIGSITTGGATLGIARVFGMKAVIILLSFAVISLAARLLGPEQFGIYSICFSAVGLLSTVSMLGQQVLLMRSWTEYSAAGDVARLKGALLFGAGVVALGLVVVATPFALWLHASHGAMLAAAVVAYLVGLTVVFTSAHLVRSAIGVGAGDGYGNILMGAAPVVYLLGCLLLGFGADLPTVFALFAAGAFAAVIIHLVMLYRLIRRRFPGFIATPARFEFAEWRGRSLKLWLSHVLEAANQYLDVLVVGMLMSPSVAGAYFVITRLANAFATAADAMNMFSTRHIPDLYFRGERAALGDLLNSVAAVTLAITIAGLAGVVALGAPILSLFNPDYVVYYPDLLLLCIGTAALGAVGPSASILVFTGHEGRYLGIMAASVTLRIVGFALLVPVLGIMGAVLATSLSFLLMAGALAWSSSRLAGLDGSVLRLLRNRSGAPDLHAAE